MNPQETRRILFIANNQELQNGLLRSLTIAQTDVLVQYNRPMFFDYFAPFQCHKVHFHNPNHVDSCWGFSEKGEPEIDYVNQAYRTLCFGVVDATPIRIRAYYQNLSSYADVLNMKCSDSRIRNYPAGGFPSAGFSTVVFFYVLNGIRTELTRSSLELMTVGFSGHYTRGHPWSGHDFSYEQDTYSALPNLQMLKA